MKTNAKETNVAFNSFGSSLDVALNIRINIFWGLVVIEVSFELDQSVEMYCATDIGVRSDSDITCKRFSVGIKTGIFSLPPRA